MKPNTTGNCIFGGAAGARKRDLQEMIEIEGIKSGKSGKKVGRPEEGRNAKTKEGHWGKK